MMSDHWKSLTRLLGAPSAAEPPEPKRKAEEAKSADSTAPSDPPRNKDTAQNRGSDAGESKQTARPGGKDAQSVPKDPLGAMLETPKETTLPGFGTSQAETTSSSNWDALVKDLDVSTPGAEVPERKETPPVQGKTEAASRTPKPSSSTSPRGTRGTPDPKSARPGGFGAGLGLDLEPEPEPPAREPATPEPLTPEPAAREREIPKREIPKRDTPAPAAIEQDADTEGGDEAGFGGPRRSRRGAQGRRRSEELTEVAEEPAQIGSDETEVAAGDEDFASGLRKSEEALAAGRAKGDEVRARGDEDEERDSSRGRRPRRGRRRGVRQRADAGDRPVARRSAEPDSTADSDDERFGMAEVSDRVDEEPTVRRIETDSEEEEDGGPRRRRRRRRRRGGSETRSESARSSESPAGEQPDDEQKPVGPAIDASFDDDYEDAEELTELRRGRGRRRGRRGGAANEETEAAAAGQDETRAPSQRRRDRPLPTADDEGAETPRPKHRDVVTWFDTVDILISSNMEKRKREPQRGRGARNGRSGRGGPRKPD